MRESAISSGVLSNRLSRSQLELIVLLDACRAARLSSV
jgi:hypothetical protein